MGDANRFRFRAWNKEKRVFFVWDTTMGFRGSSKLWGDIEQSTGLTDRNGTEIFEGDVVRIADSVNAWIIWNEENASFATRGVISRDDSEHLFGAPSCCEVIGNIHENPELLEQP